MIRIHSIRLRLTLWYAGLTLLVVLAGGLALRTAVRRTLAQEFERQLRGSAALVRGFFRAEIAEYPTVEEALGHVASEMYFNAQALEFRRPSGEPFMEVSAHRRLRAISLQPPVAEVVGELDPELAPGWTMRVRGSRATLERQLRRLDVMFAVALPALLLLSWTMGWWIIGRTLAPLRVMAEATERITPAHSGERLPIADAGDELGRLGARFNALLDRLDSALAQQRRFIADAAHELRTPIARMAGLVELERARGDGARGEVLARVDADIRRAAQLVDELLQLARADAGERDTRMERGFLDDLALDATTPFRVAAERRGVRLSLADVEETPVEMDPVLLHRLIGILLDNAIRYTPGGGRVEVRVRRFADRAVLEVGDTGIGIPPEEVPHLFERFFRGRRARDMAPEGSGLGLPIARWIAQRHGGELALLTAAGGGTVARLTLPLLPSPAAAPAAD